MRTCRDLPGTTMAVVDGEAVDDPDASAVGSGIASKETMKLFDQQQPALLVAVEGIYGGEQAHTRDQPWLVVLIDVKDEH